MTMIVMIVMKVIFVKEVMSCDVLPVAMFIFYGLGNIKNKYQYHVIGRQNTLFQISPA